MANDHHFVTTDTNGDADDHRFMARAIELSRRGIGYVEPNPPVGCVITRDAKIIAEGWHASFGGPHAEAAALAALTGDCIDATLYVTLEPCCHHGKTPPCTDAIIQAGITRVVVAARDPFPQVSGQGLEQLRQAGISVSVGCLQVNAVALMAPYLKLISRARPWVIAKWAMTLDGKLATRSGDSQWISNEDSRKLVHQLRSRVDAIVVGRRTVEADDPLLTARPPGPRTATRVVVDSKATIGIGTKLVASAHKVPLLIVTGPTDECDQSHVEALQQAGCEIVACEATDPSTRVGQLLDELGRRRFTNVLVEGGGSLLGSLFDASEVDEVHVFVAPKLVGGVTATSPIGGRGVASMAEALHLFDVHVESLAGDAYIHGKLRQ